MHCSYCIVPKVRSHLWSRPIVEILDECRRLVRHGHREIVLTGVHLGHYGATTVRGDRCGSHNAGAAEEELRGRDIGTVRLGPTQPEADLAALVRRVLDLEGTFRIRLSSLEPSEVTPELLELMAAAPDRICPHLHLPMQSGSDAVLERMCRPWSAVRFVDRCREFAEALDQPALTTDVIVGFPGETEADFEATCRAVEGLGFAKIHVFRFSRREGTPAASMPDPVPPEIQRRRASQLAEIGRRLGHRYCQSLIGRRLQVLVESALPGNPGMVAGTADRYVQVEMWGGEESLHQLVNIVACKAIGARIRAEARHT